MAQLNVNIDHVATIRQARKADEPDPVWAAAECELGGASGITMHLREDCRHIQPRDVELVRQVAKVKLNLEMAMTEAMVRFGARFEYARTVEDVLARRSRLLFLDAGLARSLARPVAEILRQETGRDPQQAAFEALADKYLRLPV